MPPRLRKHDVSVGECHETYARSENYEQAYFRLMNISNEGFV
jgi:hypothetical protein